MKSLLSRLIDLLFPSRVVIRDLRHKHAVLQAAADSLADDVVMLTSQLDMARRYLAEVSRVNLHNAAAHRASEVAALMSNNAQNQEIDRLRALTSGSNAKINDRTMPALHVPKPIPVENPPAIAP